MNFVTLANNFSSSPKSALSRFYESDGKIIDFDHYDKLVNELYDCISNMETKVDYLNTFNDVEGVYEACKAINNLRVFVLHVKDLQVQSYAHV